MIAADDTPASRANKITASILKATARSQGSIAVAMGVNESTVSRLLTDHLDKFAMVLAHAGLKVVPGSSKCFHPEYVDALLLMARHHLTSLQSVNSLEWD